MIHTFENEQAFEQFLLAHGGTSAIFQGMIYPLAGGGPLPSVAALAPGANVTRLCRAIVPQTGLLRDVSIYVNAPSGNLIAGIYDTGDAAAGVRTLLWSSGSVAAAGPGWQIVGDPQLKVTIGQHLELAFVPDNGLVTFGRVGTPIANAAASLPSTAFLTVPGGAQPKLTSSFSGGSFAMAASIPEASLAGQQSTYAMLARVS